MPFLRRLSSGPTVPELMEAELRLWRHGRLRLLSWRSRSRGCFVAASAILGLARTLLRLGLIEPECAGRAFELASRLTRSGLSSAARALGFGRQRKPLPSCNNDRNWYADDPF